MKHRMISLLTGFALVVLCCVSTAGTALADAGVVAQSLDNCSFHPVHHVDVNKYEAFVEIYADGCGDVIGYASLKSNQGTKFAIQLINSNNNMTLGCHEYAAPPDALEKGCVDSAYK